jgi:hypothetical protein
MGAMNSALGGSVGSAGSLATPALGSMGAYQSANPGLLSSLMSKMPSSGSLDKASQMMKLGSQLSGGGQQQPQQMMQPAPAMPTGNAPQFTPVQLSSMRMRQPQGAPPLQRMG